MKKRIILVILTALMLCMIMPLSSYALENPEIKYTSHCAVYNIENKKLCFAVNENDRVAPAGTAKIMTAVIAIERFSADYNTGITVSEQWLSNVSGHTVGLKAGEVVSAQDLIGALIVGSGNDAAYVIAGAVSGNIEDFVAQMNTKAAELGMNNTNYTNPAGSDDAEMYTTVSDTVKLSEYAASMTMYTELSGQRSYAIDGTNLSAMRTLYNRNYFVSNYYNTKYLDSSVLGLNSGVSGAGGWCLSVLGRNDAGLSYIIVVLGAQEPENEDKFFVGAYEDAASLLKWAYQSFGYYTILDTSTMVCEVPVKLSSKVDHVILLPAQKLVSYLPLDTDPSEITKKWELVSNELKAPLSKGQVVGKLDVYMGDELIGTVDLTAKNNVDRSNLLFAWDTVLTFLKRPVCIIVGVLLFLALIAYVILSAVSISRKNRTVRYRDGRRK